MNRAFDEVGRLLNKNAKHRKGFRLMEVSTEFHLLYANGEMKELLAATDAAHIKEEIADVLNCLFIYMNKRGITPTEIEIEMLRKLALRFPGE